MQSASGVEAVDGSLCSIPSNKNLNHVIRTSYITSCYLCDGNGDCYNGYIKPDIHKASLSLW